MAKFKSQGSNEERRNREILKGTAILFIVSFGSGFLGACYGSARFGGNSFIGRMAAGESLEQLLADRSLWLANLGFAAVFSIIVTYWYYRWMHRND